MERTEIGWQANDALYRASKEGDVVAMAKALAGGADLEAKDGWGYTALMNAARKGHVDGVKALVGAGALVDAKYEAYRVLRGKGPSMKEPANGFGRTAMMLAAESGHGSCVRALLDAGADMRSKDGDGNTALDICPKSSEAWQILTDAEQASELSNYLGGAANEMAGKLAAKKSAGSLEISVAKKREPGKQ